MPPWKKFSLFRWLHLCSNEGRIVKTTKVGGNSVDEFDLSGKVIGPAMKVHRTLGPGFLESVYKKALQYELIRAGFKAELEKPIQIRYETIVVGDYFADILVNDELIVEVKAVIALASDHEVQVVNYLTATGKDVGLLLNFGARSLEYRMKFRTYRETAEEPFRFQENSVNPVNSV
jgi:GxxExxY protein